MCPHVAVYSTRVDERVTGCPLTPAAPRAGRARSPCALARRRTARASRPPLRPTRRWRLSRIARPAESMNTVFPRSSTISAASSRSNSDSPASSFGAVSRSSSPSTETVITPPTRLASSPNVTGPDGLSALPERLRRHISHKYLAPCDRGFETAVAGWVMVEPWPSRSSCWKVTRPGRSCSNRRSVCSTPSCSASTSARALRPVARHAPPHRERRRTRGRGRDARGGARHQGRDDHARGSRTTSARPTGSCARRSTAR